MTIRPLVSALVLAFSLAACADREAVSSSTYSWTRSVYTNSQTYYVVYQAPTSVCRDYWVWTHFDYQAARQCWQE